MAGAAGLMATSHGRHGRFDDLQGLATGVLVFAIGVLFIKQAGLLTGGAVGLAFLVHYATGMHYGLALMLVNLPFYALAVRRMGRAFTLKTLGCVMAVAVLIEVLPEVLSIAHIDPYFAATGGGLLMGVGLLILFRHRASLGGLNILVLWAQERWGLRAGKLQMGLDVAILFAAGFVVPPQLLVPSVLGALLLNLALAVNHRPGRYMAA